MKKFHRIDAPQDAPQSPKGDVSSTFRMQNCYERGVPPSGGQGGEVGENTDMHYGAPPSSFGKAKILRARQTKTEGLLWGKLKKNGLGVKFRRQHPMAGFVVDFYCHKARLVVELDGEYHNITSQKELDREREKVLEGFELKILRFDDNEILNNLDSVIDEIKNETMRVGPLQGNKRGSDGK